MVQSNMYNINMTQYIKKNIREASSEELRELQLKSLEILKYFKLFCEEHSLSFFLCGGCCIGAVRHKGFIPWDDDIDVFMPRPDYEKLCSLWPEAADTGSYMLCRTDSVTNYQHTDTAVVNINTTFINSHSTNLDIAHGIGIDVIPLDGYAPTKFRRFVQVLNAMLYSLFNAQRLPDHQGRFIRIMSGLILKVFRSSKVRYRIWEKAEKRMSRYAFGESEYITELVTGLKYMRLKYPKTIFSGSEYRKFEDTLMPVPAGYDQYLSMAFGDYMSFPDEKDRIPKHCTVFYDLEEPFTKYRGIYYLINNE